MSASGKKEMPAALPIGKYKGQPIEVVRENDPSYLDWLVAQQWFREKFSAHYTMIVNFGAVPDHTPQHNALQARFLDDDLCKRAFSALYSEIPSEAECCPIETASSYANPPEWKPADPKLREHLAAGAQRGLPQDDGKQRRALAGLMGKIAPAGIGRTPEYRGWDWMLSTWYRCERCQKDLYEIFLPPGLRSNSVGVDRVALGLELKPTIGDDYPAVIRQVKQHGLPESARLFKRAVVVGRYSGEGASFVDVRKMFAAAGIVLVTVAEVESAKPPG